MQACWRKASDRTETLTMAAARLLINDAPKCPFCDIKIPWRLLSIDHFTPKSRGGENGKDNLIWTDQECNMLKGDMTGPEFIELLGFLSKHPLIKKRVLPRLKAAGWIFQQGRKRYAKRKRSRK